MTVFVDQTAPESLYLQSPESLRLHVLRWRGPASAPNVLLSHGFMHHAWVWENLAQQLRQHFNVYALDFRGHGDSQWDSLQRYTHRHLQSDILQTIAQWQLQGCHLIGHSLGARVATLLLAEHPDLAASFTMIDTGPEVGAAGVAKVRKDAESQPRIFSSVTHYYDYLRRIYSLADRDALLTFAKHSLRASDGAHEVKMDPGFTQALWKPASAHNDARDLRAPLNDQLWSALASLPMPVLLLRGAASAILSRATAERMANEVIPQAQLQTIPVAGHAVLLDNPAATIFAIDEFLQKVVRNSATQL